MTVPGVGPLVALNFIATVDDASRFRRSSDVGAFLGLTPRRYQSGEIDRSGRISKCGDAEMRRLLVSAATSLMTQVRAVLTPQILGDPAQRAQGLQESRRRNRYARSP